MGSHRWWNIDRIYIEKLNNMQHYEYNFYV